MITSRSIEHPMATYDVICHHFFAEHIDARLQEPDRYFGMGPKWRGDNHNFEFLLPRHLLPVLVFPRLLPSGGHKLLTGQGTMNRVDITDSLNVDKIFMTGFEQGAGALTPNTNYGTLNGPSS